MDLAKLALIAGGLYLLIRNTGIPGGSLFPGVPTEPTTTPSPTQLVSQPGTGQPAVTTPNQPTPATAPPVSTDREAVARLAATGNPSAVQQAESLGIKYNSDQWNWMRAAGGGGQTTTDLFPPGDRGYVMTVGEYLGRRQAAGLSGIGGWRRS
jgi:hypothetical protein